MEVNFKNIKSFMVKCSDGWVEVTPKKKDEPITMEVVLSHLSINYNPEDIKWIRLRCAPIWLGEIANETVCNVEVDEE